MTKKILNTEIENHSGLTPLHHQQHLAYRWGGAAAMEWMLRLEKPLSFLFLYFMVETGSKTAKPRSEAKTEYANIRKRTYRRKAKKLS